MNINVPQWAMDHFWEEPPPGHSEFWSFRFPPPCKVGDPLFFRFNGVTIAEAVVSHIEPPGTLACASSGRFRGGWKVFWSPGSFVDRRRQVPVLGRVDAGPTLPQSEAGRQARPCG